jgi:cytochrome P450
MGFREAQQEMAAYFTRMVEVRRQAPREDLISQLIAAEIDGERLELNAILGLCILLLIAGNETTTNLIGNAMLCLDEAPEAFAALRRDPALLPSAIEETLRYRSPVQMMFRTVAHDAVLGGKSLRAGQPVIAFSTRPYAESPPGLRVRDSFLPGRSAGAIGSANSARSAHRAVPGSPRPW